MRLKSINPFNGEVMKEFEAMTLEESAREISTSRVAFRSWKKTPIEERGGYLQAIPGVSGSSRELFAETITREMGKPIAQSLAEIEKCAWLIDSFCGEFRETPPRGDG